MLLCVRRGGHIQFCRILNVPIHIYTTLSHHILLLAQNKVYYENILLKMYLYMILHARNSGDLIKEIKRVSEHVCRYIMQRARVIA